MGPCIVCGGVKVHYNFSLDDFRVEECRTCRLMRLTPQPSDAQLESLACAVAATRGSDAQDHVDALKSATARDYLRQIAAYLGRVPTGQLLQIDCGRGEFLLEAAKQGMTVTGVERSAAAAAVAAQRLGERGRVVVGETEAATGLGQQFDLIVFADVLEQTRDPRSLLRSAHGLLKADGVVVIVLPILDSLSARLMGTSWIEFNIERFWYFSTTNLKRLLHSEAFGVLSALPGWKTVSLDYVADRFRRDPVQAISPALRGLVGVLPHAARRQSFKVPAGTVVMLATRLAPRPVKKLSVIMPAFNEAKTIAAGIERVLAKTIDGLDIELVIVESNSTDGTRAAVRAFEGRDRVRIVLEDRPQGKGHAVRAGFAAMTGDYVLIQDADDEYDIEDYDALLEPLVSGEADFVLGARHGGGSWKMRSFSGQPLLSHLMNFGHWLFRTLINIAYGVRLKDPFTMYKVFRADCLRNLKFECNRFDFDCELVIKLVRRGYVPIEIPVNYRSRSFEEGKKVNVLRDPLTWLWAIAKFRFQKL
jgi:2-polyprenyl-3-methyl-5-hydroxy-6-metoxy-1,4-benzoquinol methylase